MIRVTSEPLLTFTPESYACAGCAARGLPMTRVRFDDAPGRVVDLCNPCASRLADGIDENLERLVRAALELDLWV